MPETMYSRRSRDLVESLSPEDFETASIRSAAPSYSSETPSSHYTVPHSAAVASLPPYAAPPSGSGTGRHQSAPTLSAATASPSAASRRTASASASAGSGSMGGAVFSAPSSMGNGRRNDMPNLSQFRIPTWSNVSSNPASRHYHAVALRRAAAAEHASAAAEIGGLMRRLAIIERMEQEEAAAATRRRLAASGNGTSSSSNGHVTRPLEDPYLVGEVAARRARTDRIARESRNSGDDPLVREDRRWDWFLGQMKGRQSLGWNSHQPRFRRQFDLTMLSPTTIRHIHARHR